MSSCLKLDWCSHEAAKFAVEHWHYSRSMPAGKTVKIGVWENGGFRGTVIFSLGSNQHLGKMFGLTMEECCELTRIALAAHETPTTRIVSVSLRMLKRQSPGVRAVISYADCDQGHHGGIYAGGNWIYLGKVQLGGGTPKFRVNGVVMHGRSVHSRWGRGTQQVEWLRRHIDPNAQKVFTLGKHKYVMPLDSEVRERAILLAKPYPKRERSSEGGTAVPTEGDGSTPIRSLQFVSHGQTDEIRRSEG